MTLAERYEIKLKYQTEPDGNGAFTEFEHVCTGIRNADIVIKVEKEQGEVFYRKGIKEEIKFAWDDFDFIMAMEKKYFARYMPLTITVTHRATGDVAYRGVAYLDSDGDFSDACNGTVKVKFTTHDRYSEFLAETERPVNVLAGGMPRISLKAAYTGSGGLTAIEKKVVEETVAITFLVPSAPDTWKATWPKREEGWVMLSDIVEAINNSPGVSSSPSHYKRTTTFAREVSVGGYTPATFPYPSTDWIPIQVPLFGTRFTRTIPSLLDEEKSSTESYPMGTDPNFWTFTAWRRVYFWAAEAVTYWDNGIRLNDVIKALLPTGFTLSSHLFGEPNSLGQAPTNYTQERFVAWLVTVYYAKSDVVKAMAQNNATTSIRTLKEILAELKNSFDIYWKLEGSTFILEHLSFFDLEGADFEYTAKSCGYKYEKNIPTGVVFSNAEHGEDEPWDDEEMVFKQQKFSRYSEFTSKTTRTSINMNVLYQSANYNNAETSGFVICHGVQFGETYYMRHGYGKDYVTTLKTMTYNPFMTPKWRLRTCAWETDWWNGYTATKKKQRLEDGIVLANCKPWEIDFDRKIKSSQGWGNVKEAEYSLLKGWLKLSLLQDEIQQVQ